MKKKGFCMCLVHKDVRLRYECLTISKINPYIFVTSSNCLDQMGYNNCGYFIKKALYLQLYYYFSVSPCYSGRHKQKPLVTSDRSVTSFSKNEMNSDTHCDKPKQIIPQIQLHRNIDVNLLSQRKIWIKGQLFSDIKRKKWIRTKEDLLPSTENAVRNLLHGEFSYVK